MAGPKDKQEISEDFQVPLMNVFRAAAYARDERRGDTSAGTEDREVTQRQIERREGMSHDRLQKFFLEDLVNLMSTVNLNAAQPLDDLPYVSRSILNYGIEDVTSLHDISTNYIALGKRLRQALIDHEPRLIPESVIVRLTSEDGGANQKPVFEVEAVMAARPVDVPLEFVAEVDGASGKIFTSKLTVDE